MGRLLVFGGILSALCCSMFAQSKERPSAGTEQAVMRIERELLNAVLKGDASANERYLADTYVFTGPDGTVENKAQAIADLKSGDLKLQSASLDGAKVQVYGDTAVVTYSSNDKGTYKGKDISGKTRWTDVFVNHNGRWQVVASHGTMLPK
jgi:ketosteroid isomerase-like protein